MGLYNPILCLKKTKTKKFSSTSSARNARKVYDHQIQWGGEG